MRTELLDSYLPKSEQKKPHELDRAETPGRTPVKPPEIYTHLCFSPLDKLKIFDNFMQGK